MRRVKIESVPYRKLCATGHSRPEVRQYGYWRGRKWQWGRSERAWWLDGGTCGHFRFPSVWFIFYLCSASRRSRFSFATGSALECFPLHIPMCKEGNQQEGALIGLFTVWKSNNHLLIEVIISYSRWTSKTMEISLQNLQNILPKSSCNTPQKCMGILIRVPLKFISKFPWQNPSEFSRNSP